MLTLVYEEDIREDSLAEYFDELYKVVCVGERIRGGPVRSTYIVDWEQLVHLLEDYQVFGEDIVEVAVVPPQEAGALLRTSGLNRHLARA